MSKHEAPIERREPAVLIGLIMAFVTAVLNLVVLFGVDLSTEQSAGIVSVVDTFLLVLTAVLIRGKVYAPATVKQLVVEAKVDALEEEGRRQFRLASLDRDRKDSTGL